MMPKNPEDELIKSNAAYSKAAKAIEKMRMEAADIPEMTLDEINAEIAAVRESKAQVPKRGKRRAMAL